MEPLPNEVLLLQQRDLDAWSAFLGRAAAKAGLGDDAQQSPAASVVEVTTEPLARVSLAAPGRHSVTGSRRARRYIVSLDDVSDPVSFVGKRTNEIEVAVYRAFGPRLPGIMPRCHYAYAAGDRSWIILDDVPDNFPPDRWTPIDLDAAAASLGAVHAAAWDGGEDAEALATLPHLYQTNGERPPETVEVTDESIVDTPESILSAHALHAAGHLAPRLIAAANGLQVMRDLGGWPGVLGESQLAAAADLLDDPLPAIRPLSELPDTLVHTAPHLYHWRLTLFGEQYLLDWSEARRGPGVLDLVSLLEHYPLVLASNQQGARAWQYRVLSPAEEEMAIDSYLLAISSELGPRFPARLVRQTLPAAFCLHILTTWFPYFGSWANNMPDKYIWQRINRMEDVELARVGMGEMVGLRPYLSAVFARFMRAYREL